MSISARWLAMVALSKCIDRQNRLYRKACETDRHRMLHRGWPER
jgi:hypothetical protein